MATSNAPANLKDISKNELAEAYTKLKDKGRKANEVARREGEGLIKDLITVGSGAGMGYYLGYAIKDVDPSNTAAIEDAQQLGGIDLDLLVGGGLAAAGLMKWGGTMSDTARASGIGVLTGYAARVAYKKGLETE